MATVSTAPVAQSLLLMDISWQEYIKLLRIFARRHLRLTYDHGVLEIMTISSEHERYKHLLGRLLEALTEELDVAIAGFGSFTCKRKRKKRGLEPDECYWIASEPLVRGKDTIDLDHDPPPDLAIEVEVTRSALDRMAIYAALRVQEVWRYDGTEVTFHALQQGSNVYAEMAASLSFPQLTPKDLKGFLELRKQDHENAILRQFRDWVTQHITGTRPSETAP
jgi:Uma2 family endonuclease